MYSFSLALAFSLGLAICSAAEWKTNVSEVIAFGMPRSALIISGEFIATFSGGFGADSSVKVNKIFKAYQGFESSKEITVHWTTLKKEKPMAQMNTNSFLFFLRRDVETRPNDYVDVTDEAYPFVPASEKNIRLLRSKLTEKK